MIGNSIDEQDWEALLNGAVDGTLSDAQARELNRLLKSDSKRLDDYIRFVDLHGSLYREALLAQAGEVPEMVDFDSVASSEREVDNIGFWRKVALVASVAAVAAFAWNFRYLAPSQDLLAYDPSEYLGIITSLNTDGDATEHFVGRGLQRGNFKLENGRAQARLDNGVELSMKGPVEFNIFGLDHITLLRGRMTANVPTQAIGFRMDTPDMEVVDLGTEFALRVDRAGESKLHVLEGEVEARMKMGMDYENVPLVIAKGRLHELDENPTYLQPDFDPVSFAPSPLKDRLIQATGGQLHSLQDSPKDLRYGRFKHDYLMLFPERRDFALPEQLEVNLSKPGTYRVLSSRAQEHYLEKATEKQRQRETMVQSSLVQSIIPANTRVNSYLVHFDATYKKGDYHRAKGRVRFNRPVLGVILHGPNLNASDAVVGHSDIIYESQDARRTENDLVRISSDRRQVSMNFEIHGFIDQARIIVEAETNPGIVAQVKSQ